MNETELTVECTEQDLRLSALDRAISYHAIIIQSRGTGLGQMTEPDAVIETATVFATYLRG